ncbi:cytochrome P450 [Gonapodya prolifera JEL478]|uniref:Cytochrome P450 n=1 Tax=Gonapodya prolifera (strain JEL478) TaxID=1344416 RepID=A0A139ARQ7_GONPJ|nr:cytochrome P450 [Gonapodya prolifera JEL478]|eukprot:KXS19426.1 cytochrome P450 [Gonapodya prolifera JEL478]
MDVSLPAIALSILLPSALAIYAILVFLYPDTAAFSRRNRNVPTASGGESLLGHTRYGGKVRPRTYDRKLDIAREFGDIVRLTFVNPTVPWRPVEQFYAFNVEDVEFILRNPDIFEKGEEGRAVIGQLLGEGIFAADGHQWLVARKTASNIFKASLFRTHFSADFAHQADVLCSVLRTAALRGSVVDLQDVLLRCTIDSFARLALGTDVGALSKEPAFTNGVHRIQDAARGEEYERMTFPDIPFASAFDTANAIVNKRSSDPFWKWTEYFSGEDQKMLSALRLMDDFAQTLITKKRSEVQASGGKKGPGLEGDGPLSLLDYFLRYENDDGSELTDRQMRDVVINFLIAGRDTTAQTLSWCFWELCHHPEAFARLREEAFRVLGSRNAQCGYDHTKEMTWTTAVFYETLRLHPNVPTANKIPAADARLPGTNTRIYKGDIIQLSSYVMGRLKKVWGEDAEVWRPERWLTPANTLVRESPYKWPVFNAGPRVCLGQAMATQEACVFLSTVARKFDVELWGEDEPRKWGVWHPQEEKREGRYSVGLTLGMRGGLDVKIRERA